MSNIKVFNVVDFKDKESASNPDHVLEMAKGSYKDVLIIGYDKDGDLDVRSTNTLNAAHCLFIVQSFTNKLLNGDYTE